MSTPWPITIYGTDGNPARIAGVAVGQPPGGSSYGSSYLGSYGQGSLVVSAMAQAYAFDSPADVLVGTDLSISMDGKTITFETAGWYSVYLDTSAAPGDATTKALVTFEFSGTQDAGDILSAMSGSFGTEHSLDATALNVSSRIPFVLPGFNFEAGDTLEVTITGALIAGTAPSASGNIVIVRVA